MATIYLSDSSPYMLEWTVDGLVYANYQRTFYWQLYTSSGNRVAAVSTVVGAGSDAKSTTQAFTNLSPDTIYNIIVVCKQTTDTDGNKLDSDDYITWDSWTSGGRTDEVPVPDTPTITSISPYSPRGLQIKCTDSDYADYYYWSVYGEDGNPVILNKRTSTNSYSTGNLSYNTYYSVDVYCVNDSGDSGRSNEKGCYTYAKGTTLTGKRTAQSPGYVTFGDVSDTSFSYVTIKISKDDGATWSNASSTTYWTATNIANTSGTSGVLQLTLGTENTYLVKIGWCNADKKEGSYTIVTLPKWGVPNAPTFSIAAVAPTSSEYNNNTRSLTVTVNTQYDATQFTARRYYWDSKGNTNGYESQYKTVNPTITSTVEFTFSGLTPNTYYIIAIVPENTYTNLNYGAQETTKNSPYTYPSAPDIIKCRISGSNTIATLDYNSGFSSFVLQRSKNNSSWSTITSKASLSGTTLTISYADTTYSYFRILYYNKDKVADTSHYVYFELATKPSLWSWTTPNTHVKAKTALDNKSAPSNFPYSVWNDMCELTNDVLSYTDDKSWSSKYATLANTKMTNSDKTLTAVRFNSLRYNIPNCSLSTVYKNSPVYAYYFTTMMDELNTYINSLD